MLHVICFIATLLINIGIARGLKRADDKRALRERV